MKSLFEFLIKLNISSLAYLYIVIILFITVLCIVINILTYMMNYTAYLQNSKIFTTILIISAVIIVLLLPKLFLGTIKNIGEYDNYLMSKLTKQSYIVESISYDKKTIITDKGDKLKIQTDLIPTVKELTDDKSKVGKSYYTLDVYKPNQIKKLINIDKKETQNKLVKHIYVKAYKKLK